MKRLVFLVLAFTFLGGAGLTSPLWAAYSAHQNDTDVSSFLAVYPSAKSTKLDDCALCHPGSPNGKSGSCDYCHIQTGMKPVAAPPNVPLNGYGQDYKNHGGHPFFEPKNSPEEAQANRDALLAVEANDTDSDGDSYPNLAEIKALTFPGNAKDYPGLIPAPAIGLNLERILMLPGYSEFLLLNASSSRDFYARYRGVKMKDLLKYAGVRKEATHISVISPDGFSRKFPIGAPNTQATPPDLPYNVMGPYPYGTFYGGLDFVDYSIIPGCFDNGDRIPDKLYMLLAYLRDGDPLTPGKINPITFKLDGEGPYRLIPPQKIAGSPDRAASDTGVGYPFDATKDHNSGFSPRTVAVIRVEPLPAGTTDFNWTEGGWNLVDHAKLIVYGAIDPRTYPVSGKVSDGGGKGVPDVELTFSLLSLGQVGKATTSPEKGHSKKKVEGGRFHIDLPVGEYTVIPSKEGYCFTPASLSISLPDPECDLDRDQWDPWDHRDRWEHCNRHPENEIKIIASCSQPQ